MQQQENSMRERVCLVTGANSGIGRATALGLAKMGAHVLMVCRDPVAGAVARAAIIRESGNESVDLLVADLSSQASVRRLAQEIKEKYSRLHVLVNNAGVQLWQRALTVDSMETTFAVNYLAPFLLAQELLDLLAASAPARIVNVSSLVHKWGKIDFEDLHGEKHYDSNKAYYQSKLALVLSTYELDRRLKMRGLAGVTVNCLEPGMTRTEFARDFRGFYRVMSIVWKLFMKSPEKGAETSLYLASSAEVEGISGKYFKDKREIRSSSASYDEGLAGLLWAMSI